MLVVGTSPFKVIMSRPIRGVFAGAGSDGLNEMDVCNAIMRLTRKAAAKVSVAYLGTATYDLEQPQVRQTERLATLGCTIIPVRVADPALTASPQLASFLQLTFEACDVVVVSGGNTLYAMERWRLLGIDALLRSASSRGCVMAGGSAGAICWFDGGHSDSMDPETYRTAMTSVVADGGDEATAAPTSASDRKTWKYIRVPGLGLLPGLCCPHYDKTQSNGVPRSEDFKAMMIRNAGESVVCIDHWAALVVDGDKFDVLSVPGKERAVPEGGKPWCYFGRVEGGIPVVNPLPPTGSLSIFQPATSIAQDPLLAQCIAENPPSV